MAATKLCSGVNRGFALVIGTGIGASGAINSGGVSIISPAAGEGLETTSGIFSAISAGFFGKLTTATNRIVTKLPVNKPVINQSGIFSLIPPGKSRRILLKIVVHHPSTCSKSGKISSIPSAASMGKSGVKLCSTSANSSGFKAAANCCVELRRLSTATFGGNTVPVPVLSWETIEFNCSIASCSRITVSAWLKFSRSFG